MVHNIIGDLTIKNGCIVKETDHNYKENDNSSEERDDIVDAGDHILEKISNDYGRKKKNLMDLNAVLDQKKFWGKAKYLYHMRTHSGQKLEKSLNVNYVSNGSLLMRT